ncbi:Phytanoyl-CoA dioxygenase (PhyH) [Maioricimonas rarisocia]|uniref:Phytanoyl-CoA dioxygenase (PhyH) n=1 Tax=Maioricimonas rarisocia TaxID=2528026 RepID=A0A517Z6D4_9PLAN|nr:phytanoyl-CoA dioxygenase family protein [Maioricimonas rarisocia]QDU38052.1 Phytanoyl-CoA dioxygenase (PhyH) [Maioricimonas rarisocia]
MTCGVDSQVEVRTEFTSDERARFEADGFVVVRGLADHDLRTRMLAVTRDNLARLVEPLEFEADLQYPGAPEGRSAVGGRTVRRLKQAHSRDFVFTEWLQLPGLLNRLRQILGETVVCPLAHHNCIMTKEPAYSSDTGWHQDVRYWSFETPELVNAWLALGEECVDNGCLQVIPGTHRMTFERNRFDEELFFRTDLPENQNLIERRQYVELQPGDVLFFHARLFHSATRNRTDQTKYSVVFTFRGAGNGPNPGSRSASLPELILH